MWKHILLIVYIVAMLVVGMPQLALAESIEITVVAKPHIGGGISDFVITYVSETQLDISWSFVGDAVNIMIRGEYGGYPEDRDDGYLVYYGSGVTTSDTSMDFDENPGPLYYRAWGQKADETWYEDYQGGYEESEIMTMLGLIVLALGSSWVGLKSSYWILKLLAGGTWGILAVYLVNNPLGGDASQPLQTVALLIITAFAAAMAFMPFWYDKQEGRGRLRLPFMQTDEQEEQSMAASRRPSMTERNADYEERVKNALNGRIRRKGK